MGWAVTMYFSWDSKRIQKICTLENDYFTRKKRTHESARGKRSAWIKSALEIILLPLKTKMLSIFADTLIFYSAKQTLLVQVIINTKSGTYLEVIESRHLNPHRTGSSTIFWWFTGTGTGTNIPILTGTGQKVSFQQAFAARAPAPGTSHRHRHRNQSLEVDRHR